MSTERLKAFSDGVIAIILTIMVLELKPPHQDSIAALATLVPVFGSYVLSFTYVGIYWNNHHHLMNIAKSVNGGILWANLHRLFWLSLIPDRRIAKRDAVSTPQKYFYPRSGKRRFSFNRMQLNSEQHESFSLDVSYFASSDEAVF